MSILVLVLFSNCIYSQSGLYDEIIPKFRKEILSTENLQNENNSRILRDLSFVGAYEELYYRSSYSDSTIVNEIKGILKSYEPTKAIDLILSKTSSEQIVIINESHHRPEHRKFTADLLEELYQQGYRYLALEAIFSNQLARYTNYPENKYFLGDTTIHKRGYPLMNASSGTYVKEPAFGNMIRKALKLGYKIIGYEENSKTRELNQARNLAKLFEDEPMAKLVVHCGFGHLIEAPTMWKGKMDTVMAGHLKALTQIDPLTIDQTKYYNYSDVSEIVFKDIEDSSPQCLVLKDIVFNSHLTEEQAYWDITVFHPPMAYTEGRPNWLVLDSTNNEFTISSDKICIEYPIRIRLLEENDRYDAVPIDVLEAYEIKDTYSLYGNIDKAKIVVENQNGDRQIIRQEYIVSR